MKNVTITESEMEELLAARAAKAKQAEYRRGYRQRPDVKVRQDAARKRKKLEAVRNARVVRALAEMNLLEQFIGKNTDLVA